MGIERILRRSMFDGFERIDLPGEFVCIAITTERVDHQRHTVCGRGVAVFHTRRKELQLKSFLTASSAPDICTPASWPPLRTVEDDPVRLHGAVELRTETTDGQTIFGPPPIDKSYFRLGCCISQKVIFKEDFAAAQTLCDELLCTIEVGRFKETILIERDLDGARKDFNIRKILLGNRVLVVAQLHDRLLQWHQGLHDPFTHLRRNLNPQRWNRSNVFHFVVGWPIRKNTMTQVCHMGSSYSEQTPSNRG